MSATVYVVYGRTGEYDSATEWPVKGFFREVDADDFVGRLEAWCAEQKVDVASAEAGDVPEKDWELKCPLDPHFHCDRNTGTEYWHAPLEVRESAEP